MMNPDWVRRWRLSEARWRLGLDRGDALIALASEAATDLREITPNMAELLTIQAPSDPRDMRAMVDAVILGLDLEPLSLEDATRTVVAEVAERIVFGSIEPEDGATEIWRLSSTLPVATRPNALIGLRSEWEDVTNDGHPALQPA